MALKTESSRFHSKWFQRQDAKGGKAFETADNALKHEEAFKRKTQDLLQSKRINVNSEIACTRDSIKEQVEQIRRQALNINPLKEDATATVEVAVSKVAQWEVKRRNGRRKGAALVEKFLRNFSGFLEAYSGIVEVVKCAGAPYGEAGYEAVSLLLIVAVHKTENDEKIADALAELTLSFPRLNLMTDIYPEESVEMLVAEVYKEVIEFAREAAEYFSRSTGGRVWTAVIKPPRLGVDIAIERVHKRLAQVNAETSTFLHRNIESIKGEVKGLREQIETMRTEAEEKEQREDQSRLLEFLEILGSTERSENIDVESCKALLNNAFSPQCTPPFIGQRLKRFAQMTTGTLEAEDVYLRWKKCSRSTLLLLSGKSPPEAQIGNSTYCWLSQAAIMTAEELQSLGSHVAFYSCHPQPLATDITVRTVISHIISQLICWRPEILRTEFHRFRSLVSRDLWRQDNEQKALEAMFESMQEIINRVAQDVRPMDQIWIVLDRVDQCKCEHLFLLKQFVRLASRSVAIVKIMLVMDSCFWNTNAFSCTQVGEDSAGDLLCKLDWDQHQKL